MFSVSQPKLTSLSLPPPYPLTLFFATTFSSSLHRLFSSSLASFFFLPLPSVILSFSSLDGRARRWPCFFSRPETPTHPLVACESATRWNRGNRISLLTRDRCRQRPPRFSSMLLTLVAFLPPFPRISLSVRHASLLFSSPLLSSLPALSPPTHTMEFTQVFCARE